MVLSFDLVIELKNALKENFSVYLHMHDTCGGQSFSLDQTSDDVVFYIQDFLKKKNLVGLFREDKLGFSVEEK